MRNPELIERAKAMRREPTPFEHKLWLGLRAKRFHNANFRQQKVIGRYIVDFACRSPSKLVIEVDGDTHGDREAYDVRRTRYLEDAGYRVLRFTNEEVGRNFEGVMMTIENALPLSPLASRVALSPEEERGS
ncbi:MAG: endonuclease domain-containing protein [Sphingomicrobium sp.]